MIRREIGHIPGRSSGFPRGLENCLRQPKVQCPETALSAFPLLPGRDATAASNHGYFLLLACCYPECPWDPRSHGRLLAGVLVAAGVTSCTNHFNRDSRQGD